MPKFLLHGQNPLKIQKLVEDRNTGTMASLPLAQNDLPFIVQDDDSNSYSWIHHGLSAVKPVS